MNDIATRIAEKIYRIGAVRKAMRSLTPVDVDRGEVREAVTSDIKAVVSTEIEPLMKVLMKAVKWSYVIDGRVLRCEVCKVRTSFEAGHPFSSKLMRHKSDCWVDQAQKLIRRIDESAS